jgi:hypothetical protein
MLSTIHREQLAEIVLDVRNTSPKASGKPSSLLYRAYRWADRKLFRTAHDPFVRKSLGDIPGWQVPVIQVQPEQKKYSDRFHQDDLDRIRASKPDILLRLGFRILRGDILKVAPLGLWSFHHGDNRVNRGGPPCFWEVMLGIHETGSILQILSEKLDDGLVIYRSWSRTDPLSVHRNASKVYWKSLYFVPRVLRQIQFLGKEAWLKQIVESQDAPYTYQHPLYKPPGNGRMLGLALSLVLRTLLRKLKEARRREFWQVYAGRLKQVIPPEVEHWHPLPSPSGKYYADPCPWVQQGQTALFYESYDYNTNKARIEAGFWDGFTLAQTQPVVEEKFHLSYPFVFEIKGQLYMIPESAEAKKVLLYRCQSFPFEWQLERVLLDNTKAYDPTLVEKDGKYWLFMNQKAHKGASGFDELFLYWSNSWPDGTWHAHPQNPVVSDVRRARPAGRIFCHNGEWYRPAQDCARHYGHQMRLRRIILWDTQTYREEDACLLQADWAEGLEGTHTFNFANTWAFTDAYRR